MNGTDIVLAIISVIGTLGSVIFGYLAFSRNSKADTKKDAVDLASIKIDSKYTRDGIDRIDRRLDEHEKAQVKTLERLTKLEEHNVRTDGRLEKLEKHTAQCKRRFEK